jgi:hypothetical protein
MAIKGFLRATPDIKKHDEDIAFRFEAAALKAGVSIESLRNFKKIAQCKIPTKSELHEIISDSIRSRSS